MPATLGSAALVQAISFRQLLAEQTTPAEVLNFVVVVVGAALLTVALLYAVLMTAIWAIRLRPKVAYKSVFLPTREQFVEYAGEYLLAIGTSVLLSLTLLARHSIVEEVLSHPLHERHATQLQELLPHLPDPAAALRQGTVASVFLTPLLEAGRTSDAYAIATSVVGELGETRLSTFPTRNSLLFLCLAMMIAYLAWLARGRYRDLREPKPGEPEYARTARGLLTLAVCVGLLLLAPTLDRGVEAAAENVLAAARARDLPAAADSLVTQVRLAIVADQEAGGPMRRADLDQLRDRLASLVREHTALHTALSALGDEIRASRDSTRDGAQMPRDLDKRIATLEAWHANGTLLIFAPAMATYYVRPAAGGAPVASSAPRSASVGGRVTAARAVAREVRVLQVRLPPGSYRIVRDSATGVPIDSVVVQAGGIAVSFLLP